MTKSPSIRLNQQIVLGLAGDVMIGRLVNDYLNQTTPDYVWGNVLSLLRNTDLNLINLETALTHSSQKVFKTFNFKADPAKVSVLTEARIDVVNLANNHILDYAKAGLLETLETLDHAKIKHVGAGINESSARAPAIIKRHGITIGILGCTDNEPGWKATTSQPGTVYLEIGGLNILKNDIQRLRDKVDLLILSIHWGPNMVERPSADFRHFAHELIDLGVDIIHGHSAHIFQGIEVYKKRLILYDTGDFVDDYAIDPFLRNDRSFLFLIEVTRHGVHTVRLVPTIISNFQVNKASGKEATESIQRMQQLSEEFRTSFSLERDELVLKV